MTICFDEFVTYSKYLLNCLFKYFITGWLFCCCCSICLKCGERKWKNKYTHRKIVPYAISMSTYVYSQSLLFQAKMHQFELLDDKTIRIKKVIYSLEFTCGFDGFFTVILYIHLTNVCECVWNGVSSTCGWISNE